MKIQLEFERTASVKEKGWVEVEVGSSASIADVYKRANKREFAQFLTADREYKDEEWEFKIVKKSDDST